MTTFTSGLNITSFLPSLYAFYNFTTANSFATNQSANGTTSSPEQTTNRTEAALLNATEYEATFVDVTTTAVASSLLSMTSSSTSSLSSSSSTFHSSSSSSSHSIAFHSTAGSAAYSETFPVTTDTDFTTEFTSGFQSMTTEAHAQSVYAQTLTRFGSYGSEAVSAVVSTEATVGLQVGQLASGGHYYAAGIIVGTLAVLFVLAALGLLLCRRRLQTYHSLPSGSARNYDYLYRPLNKAGRLNEEYDHTFVGVSIPLLQEVTIV